jgi:hypothetical protein
LVRRRWRADLQVPAHLIEFALADSLDRQQILDALEGAAVRAEIHERWGTLGADAGNLLQFFNIRSVQSSGCAGGVFFGAAIASAQMKTNHRDYRGALHPFPRSGAIPSS